MSDDHNSTARGARLARRAFLRAAALSAGATALVACQPAAPAAPAVPAATGQVDWQAAWDALVAAAQREGRLVLHGPPAPETRQQLPAAFQQRFGITVGYVNLRTSELVPKMAGGEQAG